MAEVNVTIVLCTYNRSALLRDTLSSLERLEMEDRYSYEVLVVDNASTDDTPAVIEAARREAAIPIRSVRETKEGIACARNRGIEEARGEWIAFIDDDETADPKWLKQLLAMAVAKQARVVGGSVRLQLPDEVVRNLSPTCQTMLGASAPRRSPSQYTPKWAPGAGNLLVHRTVFDEVGVFDEKLREAGEDTDLYRRIQGAGIAAWNEPAAVIFHVVPSYRLEEDYFRLKALRGGSILARRDLAHRGRVKLMLSLVARLGQALLVHMPRLFWARLVGARAAALGARCLLWRAEGYMRFALHLLAPAVFRQREFLSRLEFRAEREVLSSQKSGSLARS